MKNHKTVVVIPTYNEKENIRKLIDSILSLKIDGLNVLVVDDNSPDGTSNEVKAFKDKKVHLLLREGNRGRGLAGKDGFSWAMASNADYIIEMDADFSHDPKCIPEMLRRIKNCDVVLGSRLVKGGRDIGRGLWRRMITRIANLYIGIILGLPILDCNSGFRCFRSDVFKKIKTDNIFSEGPAIVQEVLYKCHIAGFKLCEMPIVFRERVRGKSSLTLSKLIKGYITIIELKWKKMNNKLKM